MTHTTPEIEEIVNLKEWRELQATLDAIWCERPVPVPEHDLLERLARSLTTKHQEEIEKAVEAERERIRAFVLRETTVTLDSGVGIAKPEYQFGQKVIQALTPTKTDKQ